MDGLEVGLWVPPEMVRQERKPPLLRSTSQGFRLLDPEQAGLDLM